ncbi:MAG: hypothetical protein AAF726_25100 [Planctomycetota bacterium]
MIARKLLLAGTGLLVALVALRVGSDESSKVRRDHWRVERVSIDAATANRRYAAAEDSARVSRARTPGKLERIGEAPVVAAREAGGRALVVAVRDRTGLPIEGLEVQLERLGGSGVWLAGPALRSDDAGNAAFVGLSEDATYRARARIPTAPEPVEVGPRDAVQLVLDRPAPAFVELWSELGHPLTGARRVELRASGDGSHCALSAGDRPAQWTLLVPGRTAGAVNVTDSLGRVWRAEVVLSPGETSVVRPGPEWITIARADSREVHANARASASRLRWSIGFNGRSPRRGSAPLAPDGGFHAVVAGPESRASGGRLELTWSASHGEERAVCAWHPDPNLQHVALHAPPLRGAEPFPTRTLSTP